MCITHKSIMRSHGPMVWIFDPCSNSMMENQSKDDNGINADHSKSCGMVPRCFSSSESVPESNLVVLLHLFAAELIVNKLEECLAALDRVGVLQKTDSILAV